MTEEDDLQPIVLDNPYAIPVAPVGILKPDPGSDTGAATRLRQAEEIRRKHIGRETQIKALGVLFLVLAALSGLLALGLVYVLYLHLVGRRPLPDFGMGSPRLVGLVCLAYVVFSAINAGLGYGLVSLRRWSRWIGLAMMASPVVWVIEETTNYLLGPSNNLSVHTIPLIAGPLPCYFFAVLLLPGTKIVFSRDYKNAIAQAPHLRLKIGRVSLTFAGLAGLVTLLAFVVPIIVEW